MILELLVAATLLTPQECLPSDPLDARDGYINYQLSHNYTYDYKTVVFNADIGKRYHEHIKEAADKAGWNVIIEPTPGFYSYEESYQFTFTRK